LAPYSSNHFTARWLGSRLVRVSANAATSLRAGGLNSVSC
jgi:hypothetical protein